MYLHFRCESLNEHVHLRCPSYLHRQIHLSHTTYVRLEQANVNSIQYHCLFTDICVTLNMYRYDVKPR